MKNKEVKKLCDEIMAVFRKYNLKPIQAIVILRALSDIILERSNETNSDL